MSTKQEKMQRVWEEIEKDISFEDIEAVLIVFRDQLTEMKKSLDAQLHDSNKEVGVLISDTLNQIKVLEKRIRDISSEIKSITKETDTNLKYLAKVNETAITDLRAWVKETTDVSKEFKQLNASFTARLEELEASIPTLPEEITGKQIVDKINVLEIKPEFQIAKEHIKGLEDDIKRLEGRLTALGGSVGSTRAMMGRTGGVAFEKLNSRLDGATKTFTVPNLRDVIAIIGTSFPTTFASTDDYTVGNKSITFTDAIDASTTLSAGQTIIVIYNQLHYV